MESGRARAGGRYWSYATRQLLGIEAAAPVLVEVPPEQLADYAGTYEGTLVDVQVGVAEAALSIEIRFKQMPDGWADAAMPIPPQSFAFSGADRVIGTGGMTKGLACSFIRSSEGQIQWLRLGGRLQAKVT